MTREEMKEQCGDYKYKSKVDALFDIIEYNGENANAFLSNTLVLINQLYHGISEDSLKKANKDNDVLFVAETKLRAKVFKRRAELFIKDYLRRDSDEFKEEQFTDFKNKACSITLKDIIDVVNLNSNPYANAVSATKVSMFNKFIADNDIKEETKLVDVSDELKFAAGDNKNNQYAVIADELIAYLKKLSYSNDSDEWTKELKNNAEAVTEKLKALYDDLTNSASNKNDKDITISALNFPLEFRQMELKGNCGYYLFDNSYQEIQFGGISYKWFWRYETGSADLFRNVERTEFKAKEFRTLSYPEMIKALVEHMNTGCNKDYNLSSWSKDPVRDIYKYLNVPDTHGGYHKDYTIAFEQVEDETKNGEECNNEKKTKFRITKIDELDVDAMASFSVIKNAQTNVFAPISESSDNPTFKINDKGYTLPNEADIKSFDELIGNEQNGNFAYCVDVWNNKAPYEGDIRAQFSEYARRMGGSGVQLSVVSSGDKEVIMLGSTCTGYKEYDGSDEKSYDDNDDKVRENTEYNMSLSVKEIVVLYGMIKKELSGKNEIRLNESAFVFIPSYGDNDRIILCQGRRFILRNFKSSPDSDEKKTRSEIIALFEEYYYQIDKEVMANNKSKNKLNFIMSFIEKHSINWSSLNAQPYNPGATNSAQLLWRELILS